MLALLAECYDLSDQVRHQLFPGSSQEEVLAEVRVQH